MFKHCKSVNNVWPRVIAFLPTLLLLIFLFSQTTSGFCPNHFICSPTFITYVPEKINKVESFGLVNEIIILETQKGLQKIHVFLSGISDQSKEFLNCCFSIQLNPWEIISEHSTERCKTSPLEHCAFLYPTNMTVTEDSFRGLKKISQALHTT